MSLDHSPDQVDLIDLLSETVSPRRRNRKAPKATPDWITPREVLEDLGTFDLDPCASKVQPWPCATNSIALPMNGLEAIWKGRVWLNPPHGTDTAKWMRKIADHGFGTALVFARTDAPFFAANVWSKASALYFLKGRIRFNRPDGSSAKRAAGAASMLVAYGKYDAEQLENCQLPGSFVRIDRSTSR